MSGLPHEKPKEPDWIGFVRELIDRGEFGKFAADIVLAPPAGYLKDAEKAFTLGLNEGASLLCRASMEAAMYTFLYADPAIGSRDPNAFMQLRKPGQRTGFESLYHRMAGVEANGVKLLSELERRGLWLIGEHGHSVAHIVERFHRALVAMLVNGGSDVDMSYPERTDIAKDLEAARAILDKLRSRLAARIQAQVASARKS